MYEWLLNMSALMVLALLCSLQLCRACCLGCHAVQDYTGDPLVEFDVLLSPANNLELHEESMPGPGLQSLRDRAAIYRQHLITAMTSNGREEPTQCAVCLDDIEVKQATKVSAGYRRRLVVLPCVPSWLCSAVECQSSGLSNL